LLPGCLVAVAVVALDLVRPGLDRYRAEEAEEDVKLFAG
jgi:molybdopterin biosynthesis enzyme